ncbi:type II toxin-antitoxin system VapC family toxin [Methylobacterium sp. NEAU 140]|uniref:type II toxin-antitoxin system VapC family toxin n=1 Tax=Methylobacterium sp. NEAU 140 TaxID=3064945 RepID=UPI0027332EAB|nr:type II toxin-antitoxin system VapC family toxin [Methylobacterium sp. NEAU 140]MDP4026044.1 type II toxin-antitoxin system VapC family toxin [Methylobacterium sp. NEAU 140]
MIIVDTNVWIDHLRASEPLLVDLMREMLQRVHPYVVGELMLGNVSQHLDFMATLEEMPQADVAEHREVLDLIVTHQIYGLGIGYVDAHLLASAKLMPGSRIWTRDKRLASICDQFGVSFQPLH